MEARLIFIKEAAPDWRMNLPLSLPEERNRHTHTKFPFCLAASIPPDRELPSDWTAGTHPHTHREEDGLMDRWMDNVTGRGMK